MEKKPRIALILSSLEVGGTQRVMMHLAEGLLKEGFVIDIVAVRAQGPFLKIVPAEANLIDLGAKRALSAIPALIQYLRKYHPEAILSGLTHINFAAIISRYFSGISTRLIVSERNNLSQKKIHKPKLWDRLIYAAVNLFYPFADAIITVSKDVADDLAQSAKLDPKKIIPIHNPIPVDEIRNFSTIKITHAWFSDTTAPLILAVGRLHQQKDYPTLIKAFNILRKRRPAHLMIIGEGKERQMIEKKIKNSPYSDDICLMGKIDNPFPYMAKAEVFVLSSEWEGFGNVLVEALACGATVVSTDCHSGPREILGNNKYGLLVPVGDSEALAKAIERSIVHPFPPRQGIARARDFSVEKAVMQYIGVLLPGFKVDGEIH
jgi:glycosyltransferase involved in cell wall biosynthesis